VIAEGSSDELKDQVGGERIEVRLEDRGQLDEAVAALEMICQEPPVAEDGVIRVAIREHSGAIAAAVRHLDDAQVAIDDIAISRPTLDDVFLTLTGRAPEHENGDQPVEPASAEHEVVG
jgi:ABC-2 type transport system ATP-binding protein